MTPFKHFTSSRIDIDIQRYRPVTAQGLWSCL